MNNNESGSLYDQFAGAEAPQQPVREENWQANRASGSNKYDNNNGQPPRVKEAMRIEQKDNSLYAFGDYVFHRNPKSEFDRTVNIAFGAYNHDEKYKQQRDKYIVLYRQMMDELD